MSTIDPNQGIIGSDKTAGDVLGGDPGNPQFSNQILDFNQFLFFQDGQELDSPAMSATGIPGEYLLTTQDGQAFKVINTDEVNLDLETPIALNEDDNPNLILGGIKDVNVQGSDADNKIMGNLGNNVIDGGGGDDLLGGGAGDDTLTGGEGNDELIGGAGNDQLEGGAGDDTFAYPQDVPPGEEEGQEDYSYGDDVIRDFGQGDDTLILGDFNGDGIFDSNDYVVENTENGALITFMGTDGSRGSVLLQGVSAEQLTVVGGETGQITLSDSSASSAMEHIPEQLDDNDDDDNFFTIV